MKPRCFIAMAFGKNDTDALYDHTIKPILSDLGIVPIRIDRIDFIGNIDEKIISELNKCDIVISDLTYARPSVYFEAGYAESRVPVIYTCRQDHLSKEQTDDPYGNLRVHFDVKMKNIVVWSDIDDEKFAQKLRRRLSKILQPIFTRIKKTKKLEKETERFSNLPIDTRLEKIVGICKRRLRRRGYSGPEVKSTALDKWYGKDKKRFSLNGSLHLKQRHSNLSPGWLGTKIVGEQLYVSSVHVTTSLTKSKLKKLWYDVIRYPVYDLSKASMLKKKSVTEVKEHWFLCSLKKVPWQRFTEAFSSFQPDQENKILRRNLSLHVPILELDNDKEFQLYRYKDYEDDDVACIRIKQTKNIYEKKVYSSSYSNDKEEIIFIFPKGAKRRECNMRSFPEMTDKSSWHHINSRKIRRTLCIHLFDDIKSEKKFTDIFSNLLKKLET